MKEFTLNVDARSIFSGPSLLQTFFFLYLSNQLLAVVFEIGGQQDADTPLALYLPSTVILDFSPTV